jgi:hypothetical protein
MRFTLPILALLLPMVVLAAAPPANASISPMLRDAVIDHFSPQLVLPRTAIWHFASASPYLLGGTLVCGDVNYQNSVKKYVGRLPFYLVVKRNGLTGDGGMLPEDPLMDPTDTARGTYVKLCGPVPPRYDPPPHAD